MVIVSGFRNKILRKMEHETLGMTVPEQGVDLGE